MKRAPPGLHTVKGIDISHWQPHVNFDEAVKNGVKFCMLKVTEGTHYVDPTWERRRQLCHNVGIIPGFYHFFRPASPAIKQAEFFCAKVGKLKAGEMPMILDWETTDGVPSAYDVASGLSFCDVVEQHTGRPPMIYGSPYFLEALRLAGGQVRRFPLWIAHYGTNSPLIPTAWDNWTFWQTSESYHLPGTGVVDANLFNGTEEDLRKFVVQ